MAELTREEFSQAVAATIGSVHHFYREVTRLYTAMKEALQAEPDPFVAIGGAPARPARDLTRTIVRNHFGELFEPSAGDPEEFEDEVESADEEDDEGGNHKKRPPVTLSSDQPLLIAKIALFDPKLEAQREPEVQYAVIGDWACGQNHKSSKGVDSFELARYMLKRVVRAFDAASPQSDGQRVVTRAMIKGKGRKANERQVSFQILGRPQRVPIFDLSTPESIDALATAIRECWRKESGVATA